MTNCYWIHSSLFYHKKNHGTCVESWVLIFARPNSQHKSRASPPLQNMLSGRHPCHTWDSWLETPCEVVSPNFLVLNGWDCTDWAQVRLGGLRTPCEPALRVSRETHVSPHTKLEGIQGSHARQCWWCNGPIWLTWQQSFDLVTKSKPYTPTSSFQEANHLHNLELLEYSALWIPLVQISLLEILPNSIYQNLSVPVGCW